MANRSRMRVSSCMIRVVKKEYKMRLCNQSMAHNSMKRFFTYIRYFVGFRNQSVAKKSQNLMYHFYIHSYPFIFVVIYYVTNCTFYRPPTLDLIPQKSDNKICSKLHLISCFSFFYNYFIVKLK